MRTKIRTTLASAAAVALVVGTGGVAAADDVRTTSTDPTYDATTRTFTLHVGDSATASLTYYATATGKSGCDLTGPGSYVEFDSASSVAGVVSGLTSDVRYTDCGDEDAPPVRTVTFTGAVPGTTSVTFPLASYVSNGKGVSASTFESTLASFTVVVLGDEGRDAPAIANDYLHNDADDATLAACQAENGTNPGQTNWQGQLIAKIAQYFEGQTFTEDEEYIVVDKVRDLCGL